MQKIHRPAKGQSLVETAIILPILIFMMIGVFEVGWALRGYLVLVNVNRETTRFAVRPGYLNFSEKDPAVVGYSGVLTQANASLGLGDSQQLPLDFETNSVLIISHLVVDTGRPCEPSSDPTVIAACNCDAFVDDTLPYDQVNAGQNFTYDDLVLTPETPGYEFYLQTYPTSTLSLSQTVFLTITSQVDYSAEANRLAQQNNKFNCELMKKGGIPSANNIIITEVAYEQPQLFGFPLISNPFTDPVPLYTRTSMRIVAGARSGGNNTDTVGPVCEAYPWYVTETQLATITPGSSGDVLSGWVKWNPNPQQFGASVSDVDYLSYQVQYPRMAINDYQNPDDSSDSFAAAGKRVNTFTVVPAAGIEDYIKGLSNQEVIIPVLGTGDVIVDFIKVRVVSDGVDLAAGEIEAVYNGESVVGTNCLGP